MERVDYSKLVIQDLVNLEKSQELDLNPWYQRRSVWTRPQKSYLINSLLENKPIPSLYLRHYLDIDTEKSIKEVVDGQQRIRSILEYVNNIYRARHPNYKNLIKYKDLTKSERESFKMTSLSIGFLIGATDSDVIEIFGRLNSVSKTLNSQEKRNARFSGEMKQFCLKQSSERVQLWRDLNIFSSNDIARMLEVQFVSDLALNMLSGMSDYSSAKLDKLYEKFDDAFPSRDRIANRMEKVYSKIASLDPKSIKDTIFSRSPIFFSLFLYLDSIGGKINKVKLKDSLYQIDKMFNSDIPIAKRPKQDANFIVACTSSTQRIRSRKTRDKYIRSSMEA